MGIVTEYDQDDLMVVTNRVSYPGCQRDVETTAKRTIGYTHKQWLEPEHRVKPVPVFGHVTSRAYQFRRIELHQKSHTKTNVSKTCPTTGRTVKGESLNYAWLSCPVPSTAGVEVPDWAGPLRAKILDDMVSFAESIGELKELIDGLKNGTSILKRAMNSAVRLLRTRGNRRRLRHWIDRELYRDSQRVGDALLDVASTHLAIKFGIIPNISLMQDALAKLDRLQSTKRRVQVTLIGKQVYRRSDLPGGGAANGQLIVRSKAVAYLQYKVGSDFTAGNIAESIWAGIPCSFIVDWFIDVSSYLASFNVEANIDNLAGSYSRKGVISITDNRKLSASSVIDEPGYLYAEDYSRGTFTKATLPYSKLPQFELPTEDLLPRLQTLTEILATLKRRR